MSKRRLTRQQSLRIAQRQRDHHSDSALASTTDAGLPGLVISRFGSQADIEHTGTGLITRCHLRANLGEIVAGDRVIWQAPEQGSGVVVAVQPRASEFCRPDSYGKLRLAAANITRALITIAPEPEAHANLIDRYLIAAENLGLDVVLLVNKADLVEQDHPLHALLDAYRALGYPVVLTSVHSGMGLEPLREVLSTGISIFVGQSGVGKSSLIQALLPDETIRIGKLSEQVRKGRHTTTYARLYHFPSGGDCIDSPGIREFGLWHMDANQIARGFREFQPFIDRCRFRNCSHLHEPGCELQAALAAGKISQPRYASYRQIVDHLDDVSMQPRSL